MSPSTTREQVIRSIEQLPERVTARDLVILVAATVEESDPQLAAALRRLVEATGSATLTESAHVDKHASTDAPGTSPQPAAERSALDYLGDYVGALDGVLWSPDDADALPPKDVFAAVLLDDQRRELAGLTKREWQQLDADQKAAVVAAGATRWH